MSVSLDLFSWRWSSIELSPTKVRLVAWHCSLGQDLDAIHGKIGHGRGRTVSRERLWDYIIVIMQRLNSREASFEVCRETASVHKRRWDHILFELQTQRCVCAILADMQREHEGENWIVGWTMKGKRKKGMIREPPWWRCLVWAVRIVGVISVLMWYCSVTRERKGDLKSTPPVTLRGFKFQRGKLILTDKAGHATKQEKGMYSAISCSKCTSSVKQNTRIQLPYLSKQKKSPVQRSSFC